ncbi:MAG: hypothetical protein K5697_10145 [Lachnospiraceae bacterium]|nr:hypothetical protein [Lachnospiraceae bacterium]
MSIRTNYEKWYEGEYYYWGLEPGDFLEELIELCPPSADKKVLDIGCGEGNWTVSQKNKASFTAMYSWKSPFLNCRRIGIRKKRCGSPANYSLIFLIGNSNVLMK